MTNAYEPGTRVTFVDANATVSDGVAGLREGTVNGPAVEDDRTGTVYVPVFAERDNGREATTIMVHVNNLVGES